MGQYRIAMLSLRNLKIELWNFLAIEERLLEEDMRDIENDFEDDY